MKLRYSNLEIEYKPMDFYRLLKILVHMQLKLLKNLSNKYSQKLDLIGNKTANKIKST